METKRIVEGCRALRRASSSTRMSPADLSAADLARAFRGRTLSPVEVTEDALARLDRFEPAVGAFVHVDREGARAAARASEARWTTGAPLSDLDGVPATVKDNIAWKGLPTRKGSKAVPAEPEAEDAPAVARLREAGAVLLGKTTMPEFGWKGLSDSPLTGLTRNPWKSDRTTGGSSAGAAACAALGIGRIHLGTDGAGSVRIPAAFTGVVGLKPTYGRVPAYPLSVMGGLAHVGTLTRSVDEAALALDAIGRPDPRDLTAWPFAPPPAPAEEGVRGLRLGYSPRLGFVTRIDPEIERVVAAAAKAFVDLGAVVEEADPGFDDPIDVLNDLWFAGAALALRGVTAAQRAGMDRGLVAAAEAGARLDAASLVERQNVTRLALARTMHAYHARYDALLTPQMPCAAIPFGADAPPPGFGGVADWGDAWTNWSPFTYPFNITQQPAIGVPCGRTREGLPVGLQIVGPRAADGRVLRIARAFEAARPFAPIEAPRA
jgi:aspartyl-tRNA(Asn)/glutamyl-tRNA(Gln) amidotransferase subunit A